MHGELETLKSEVTEMTQERRDLMRQATRAEDVRAARADANTSADIDKKDKKIAELTEELLQFQKLKSEELARERDLWRQKEDLEKTLQQRTEQLSQTSSHSARLDAENEMLKKKLAETEARYRTLSDEHLAMSIEMCSTEEKLKAKKSELDNLLARWIKEKEAAAAKMNADMDKHEKAKQMQKRKDLAEAASSKDAFDGELAKISGGGGGGVATIPQRVVNTVQGHGKPITSCRFSPQGGRFATGSEDKSIKIWDGTGRSLAQLRNHAATVTCLRFSPSGEILASGSADNKIHIYNLQTFRSVHTLNNHTDRILDVVYNADGTHMFSTGKDHKINMFDGKTAGRIKSSLISSTCVAMAHVMGTCLVTAHFDKSLHLRDVRVDLKSSHAEMATEHSEQITGVCASPDGNRLLTFSKDHSLKEFDIRAEKLVNTFTDPGFRVSTTGCHATYSPDSAYIASGAEDGTVVIWEAATTKVTTKLSKGTHTLPITACAWKPSGDELITVGKDAAIKFWAP